MKIYPAVWSALQERGIVVDPALVLAALLAVFFILGMLAALRLILGAGRRNAVPDAGKHPGEGQESLGERASRHSMGLKLKLVLFAVALAALVVGIAYALLSRTMLKTQQEALMNALRDRCAVVLNDVSSIACTHLPAGNIAELSLLPAKAAAIPEARYLTITGMIPGASVYEDRVWATSDPDIFSRIDTAELQPGVSLLSDSISPRLGQIRRELNAQAKAVDGAALEAGVARPFLDMTRRPLSEPEFVFDSAPGGNRRFVLFAPILYRHGPYDNYFQGLIRMEVSVDSIAAQLYRAEFRLLQAALLLALCALALGITGALALSPLIVQPIRKLVRHVEAIRDVQELDISIGREIQKKFLPLEIDQHGNKLSSGSTDTKNASFFGYYEGAHGISGDYFDYKDIDGRYYAIIKCDIAGKGTPAALLMIQVATMFLNYFRKWEPSPLGMRIEDAVYQINSFIETLGFKGRFAAFTLCIFDTETGDLHFCNAGDNIIHICDTSEKCFKSIILPATPAAGALPNSMVEAAGGYHVQTVTLGHNDILLLYTDGIEESKRMFRDMSYRGIVCTAGNAGESHGNHVIGEQGEEMGAQRVQDIVNAVLKQQAYSLYKWHNPEGEQDLVFDFSACKGKPEEIIMALVSVEKMFRCYRHPRATEANRVLVDRKIDAFLKKHFLQYQSYCGRTRECLGNDSYLYYTHLMEDEQYDDLSILGIKRK
ncbi:MAG: SpoIIE family protein phosphatase [Treponema sp.]|jgi:serine phosphatase RsbU (regulator of sigma subunit)|nr:SpoIIE family protein phosphatase [Treponema sp.]